MDISEMRQIIENAIRWAFAQDEQEAEAVNQEMLSRYDIGSREYAAYLLLAMLRTTAFWVTIKQGIELLREELSP